MMVMTCRDALSSAPGLAVLWSVALLQSALVLVRKLLAHKPRGRQKG